VDSSGKEGNNTSRNPAISGDGRYIAFESSASNLVSGDTNSASDIFRHDTQTGDTIRVSVDSNGNQTESENSNSPAISDNGRIVSFYSSAGNLVSGDSNYWEDIFIHDTQTGKTVMVSVDSSGNQANARSVFAEISADGRYVVYYSEADNLVHENDTNGVDDAFRVDVTALPH
jgi:Tol biopolymer transport system component